MALARFDSPFGLAVGSNGAIYIADEDNHRIRMIFNGQVTTLAGNGVEGFADGDAAEAQFNNPSGVAVSSDGTVYVADYHNHRIRMIRDGQVTTLAGTDQQGTKNGSRLDARFNSPTGIALGSDGTVYVADQENHCIRMIRNDKVTKLAGTGSKGFADGPAAQAKFHCPQGVAVGSDGSVYIADSTNNRIRLVRDGQVTTLAGSGVKGFQDGAAAQATFYLPVGVAVGPDGAVYVADESNHRIRVIHNDQVTTLAGNGAMGFADGAALLTQFNLPSGVAMGHQWRCFRCGSE